MKRRPQAAAPPRRTAAGAGKAATPSKSSTPPRRASGMNKTMREKMKANLLNRQKESEKRKGFGGSTFLNIEGFDDLQFWNCGNGDHLIDIIPFIAGANDPVNAEGEPAYVLDVYVHTRQGPMQDKQILCLNENYGEPCPICEHALSMRAEGADKEDYKPHFPTRRTVYNVVVQDSEKEKQKGVQLWNVAHFYMEKHLNNIQKGPVRPGKEATDSYIVFAHPDEGRSIAFEVVAPKSKDDFPKFEGHRFADRDYSTDEYLDAAYCLSDFLKVPTYDEVYALHWGEEEEAAESVEAEQAEQAGEGEELPPDQQEEGVEQVPDEFCPVGGQWGEDCNKLEACEECPQDTFEACAAESEKIQEELKAKNEARRARMAKK